MTAVLEARCSSTVDLPAVAEPPMVPLVTGELVEYANLDHAASAPCLDVVRSAVADFLPWSAGAHRGAGFAARVSSEVYEEARERVRRFVDAPSNHEVIFTRNTTDALNLLARSLPRHTSVVCLDTEHHAALLPWRGPHVYRIPTPDSRAEAVHAVDRALAACPTGPALVVVAGASNVTGELLPVAELVAVARGQYARIAVDAAQLAPHRAISLRELDVDYLALSGDKLYAPLGAGALIGRADWLRAAPPYLAGGGAARHVTRVGNEVAVAWHYGVERHEAGSPNVAGAYALGVACDTLARHRDAIDRHEDELIIRLRAGLRGIAGLTELRLFADGADRVGMVSFVIEGLDADWLAAVLSAEYAIGVRAGAFCAHVATRRALASAGAAGCRAVRVSFGVDTTVEQIDRLIRALRNLTEGAGPRWQYARVDGHWVPSPDPRELPRLR